MASTMVQDASMASANTSVKLNDRLAELSASRQSWYLILQHNVKSAPGLVTPPHTPLSVAATTSRNESSASYAVSFNSTVVNHAGSLEEGGLEGLRKRIKLGEVQFVFLRFKGEIVFIQYIDSEISAVQRARSMVVGRSLLSQSIPWTPSTTINISHPRQLTDPFIRSKLASKNGTAQSRTSAAIALPITPQSPQPPDVPTSVSMNSFSPAIVTPSMSAETFKENVDPTSATTTTTTTMTPARMQKSTSLHVGLGIGNLGDDLHASLTAAFPSLDVADSDGQFTSAPVPRQSSRSDRSPALSNRQRATSASSAIRAFPIPPVRRLFSSKASSSSQTSKANRKESSKEGQQVAVASSSISQMQIDSTEKTHMQRLHPSKAMTADGHSSRLSPSRTSVSSSSISANSAVLYYVKGVRDLQDDNQDGEVEEYGMSNDQSTLSSSLLEAEEERVRQEQLEQERIEFLRWRDEQERMMASKERRREEARRRADEAQRDRIMRRLIDEQLAAQQRAEIAGQADDGRSATSASLPSLPPLNLPAGRTSVASSSASRQDRIVRRKRRSGEVRSVSSLNPPNAPLPALPMRFPSFKADSGTSSSLGSERIATNGAAALFTHDSPTGRPDGRAPSATPSCGPPLNGRVREAIEREMRRPVITLEGHVRPRVSRQRAKSLATMADDVEAARKASQSAVIPPLPTTEKSPLPSTVLGQGDPLLQAMLEASRTDEKTQRADRRSSQAAAASPAFKSRPCPIKTVEADGRPIGAGWTLTTADVQKSLPATPLSSEALSESAIRANVDNEPATATSPPLKLNVEDSNETTWQSLLDYINDNNRAVTPSSPASESKIEETTSESAVTLIDQVFRFAMLTSMSKKADEGGVKQLDVDEGNPVQQIRALQERQDVLEQMLIELQRRRTMRSDREVRYRQRWHRQSKIREALTIDVRTALEEEEQDRRQTAAKEEAEEEENVRVITLIMFPPPASPNPAQK